MFLAIRSTMKHALVAQRIEHLTTDQKVRGSNPFERTFKNVGYFSWEQFLLTSQLTSE